MSTYLELCQSVARESGTVPGSGKPTAVTSQTGRLGNIVDWVDRAWRDIQRSQQAWKWMYADFSGSTAASTQRYTATALGIASRFSRWVPMGADGNWMFSVFLPADGQATETHIRHMEWQDFKRLYLFGSAATDTGKPQVMSVDESQQIVFYPIPDAVYTVRGTYYKSPQIMTADDDEPEMPAEFHDLIRWRALLKLGGFDENVAQYPFWKSEARAVSGDLIAHQLPSFTMDEPLL